MSLNRNLVRGRHDYYKGEYGRIVCGSSQLQINSQCNGKSRKLLNLNEGVCLSVIRIDYLKNQKEIR